MKRWVSIILSVILLLSMELVFTASAKEALILVSPRKAIAVEETLDLTTLIKSGTVTKWQSSDPTVLSVNASKAVGKKLGDATLTATDADGKTATCYVTVGYYTGIDVSYAQTVDWDVLSTQGIDFAMFRSSYGWYDEVADKGQPFDFQMDKQLVANVTGAKKVSIPFGLYHYSYAASVSEAKKEAAYLLKLLEQNNITPADMKLPVALDVENNTAGFPILDTLAAMGKQKASQVVIAFCEDLQAAGFRTALYTSKSYFLDLFDLKMLSEAGIRFWMAWYPKDGELDLTSPPKLGDYTPFMWQYSETGRVTGVTRLSEIPEKRDTVDLNALYMTEMMLHRPNEDTNPDPTITLGDVDINGLVTASDALLALQHSTEKVTLQPVQITAADVDKDGTVTASDALTILQYSTKKITQL